ncbi:cobyrinate a,c-diamide synthase [Mesorhizobium sp. NBSH29]|uniref:cobyrinate a,c-diamide synthase n=1 Tax=Mesorhizobium sp. NBSH29 TaxID=2654249 RepID=UPI001896463C|nr:cobyrinate a,c-diamide synthase [Mesorhizobium sp. NBSH29]QPC86657.1 cobyrinate a,c-diamide synthase [Mesorhizobium sp. NBSH29]
MSARGIIIGAPRSGSGKTSVTIGLLRALTRRGLNVRGAKSGPDYIDPGFHAAATGKPGVNLDSWAMGPDLLNTLAASVATDADYVIAESAMGLFDGIPGEAGRSGSAADLARLYRLPVILVLDVSGQSQTAAAIAKGFACYDSDVKIAGVILNRLGSERHKRLTGDAIEALGIPVVGAMLRDPTLTLPERHLGLVQAGEYEDLMGHLDRLADMAESALDIERILELAGPFAPQGNPKTPAALPPPGQRIALAQDAAFTFLYPHLEAGWRAAGAELIPFSPLADEGPADDCDVCWLPGGYPELHAGKLAAADNFRAAMHDFAKTKPVHGECGGFMALGEGLEDADGTRHQMLGLLGHSTSYAQRKMNLGYRRAIFLHDTPFGPKGTEIRGHEFHYARLIDAGTDAPLADLADGQGNALGQFGGKRGHVSGAFFHAIAQA